MHTVSFQPWQLWKRILFRFFFVYILLQIAPWTWLDGILPFIGYVTDLYRKCNDFIINLCNQLFLHFTPTGIVNNGSGDTTEDWKTFFSYLIVSAFICLIWSLADRKRQQYEAANYWLRVFILYFLIINCISYGAAKIYTQQMPFPTESQLATPLGDFLPMRFSWMFIGYSKPYEMFSGIMEVVAGCLLLFRQTRTLGLLTATAVFLNVMMLNLCYDIPVKLFSIHLTAYCIYLLLNDAKRLVRFFFLNQAVSANTEYRFSFPKKWMRITRIVLKTAFILIYVLFSFISVYSYYDSNTQKSTSKGPFRKGVYDVISYAVNKDTIQPMVTDSIRWRDMIFDSYTGGSVGSTDTSFRQRYRRGYFNCKVDTATQQLILKKSANAKDSILFRYALDEKGDILLNGRKKTDSLFVRIRKSNRHFQLAEKQFHWFSEANR
jgi:hypothetical protein